MTYNVAAVNMNPLTVNQQSDILFAGYVTDKKVYRTPSVNVINSYPSIRSIFFVTDIRKKRKRWFRR